ncbi:MAG: hypothetical protein JST87_08515 [Bacteroidetes bacterium]|nr:hypothetical protein [Bacteroidota bacterium]MBS1932410.1 hypothetical protein [Bacteroidota bacterium]
MKKIFYLIVIAAFLTIVVGSCKKTGNSINPLSDIKSMGIGTYLVLDSTVNLNMDYSSIATSNVGVMVEQYKTGQTIDHIVVYVSSSFSYDTADWHMVKTVSYSGKNTLVSVSGTELADALGITPADLSPGTSYTFYNRAVTKSGDYWDISNTGYANDGTNLIAGSNYHSAFYFTANIVCPFVAPMAGTYKVIEDDWVDWHPGDLVQVTDGPGANELNLSQVWPNPAYGTVVSPLYCDVDPATGVATIPSGITWGDYGSYKTSTLDGSSGNVFSCTGLITLSIHVNATGYGDQGFLKLILQKQ